MKRIEEIAKEAGIEHKEIEEAKGFYSQVDKILSQQSVRYGLLDNFFCGNNLVTWFWLAEKPALRSKSYDIIKTNKSRRLKEKIESYFPTLASRNNFFEIDLTSSWPAREDNQRPLAIAVHACGNLSDIFIKNCVGQRVPFALAPCCHKKKSFVVSPKEYPPEADYDDTTFDFYQDKIRIKYAVEQGYRVFLESLPKEITPKNTILLGVPQWS